MRRDNFSYMGIGVIVDPGSLQEISGMPFWKLKGHEFSQKTDVVFIGISVFVKNLVFQEDGHVGSFDVFGSVKQLLQTRDTQCDVFVRDAGQMESV